MRFAILSLLLVLTGGLHAQTSVGLRIDHKAGQAEFDNEGPWTTTLGEEVYINRLEYYMSMFTLVHDGGQETAIEGSYVLADGFEDEIHPLGQVEGVQNVEGLKFFVGVDPDNNAGADPTLWPADHPLYPQVPSMHWGWDFGYRFIALEGGAGANGLVVHEVHALGDDNHFPGETEVAAAIENGMLILDVEADVLGFYQQLAVGSGVINHGFQGEATLVCNNLADHVFRPPGAAHVESAQHGLGFALVPVKGGAELRFDSPLQEEADVVLLDVLGRPLQSERISVGTQRFRMGDVKQGAFLLSIQTSSNRATRRWIQG